MKEFLIRCRDNDFCLIHVSKCKTILHPNSFDSKKIDGWGDYRIKVDDCEISFSFEEVGIQISFEGCAVSTEIAQSIVDEICRKVEKEVSSPCYSIQISE